MPPPSVIGKYGPCSRTETVPDPEAVPEEGGFFGIVYLCEPGV